eukprot:TRINITY_DN13879_c0_g2_i1.p1 TRINITY_DN13879_c0_g2~~TRINITY_DN13879_c0_g2_i1.p1  ORF type:complete len:826 (-),score=228.59 TRINITY_DN13879_c0_g2_i1:352-2829(-)
MERPASYAILVSAAGGMSRFAVPGFSQSLTQGYPPRPHPQLGPPPGPPNSSVSLLRPVHSRPLPPVLKPPSGMSLSELAAKGVGHLSAPMERTHTTVYVGKISPTVEDDVVKSILEFCGAIRSWKRAQDPTSGSSKGFGFCEFESAEGVLRAGRLLNKFSLDGQELVLNVNQATREYLERYVSKKRERQRILREEALAEQEEEAAPGVEISEHAVPVSHIILEKLEKLDNDPRKFGLVTEHDVESDSVALQKLTLLVEEREKLRPLPLPLPASSDAQGNLSVIERSGKSKDGDSGGLDVAKSDDLPVKVEDETPSDSKGPGEERMDGSSSDRGRRSERDRERDREREIEREKERELERYERERERERLKRERDRENRSREAEHLYEEREREWEAREREKERQRVHDRERERDRERDRRREIKEQEEEGEDEDWRKRRYRESLQDEKRKRRQREREEDIADRFREEQDAVEVKRQRTKDCRSVDMEVDSVYQSDAYVRPAELPAAAVISISQELMEISSCSGSASESERPEVGCASTNGVNKIVIHGERSVVVVVNDSELKVSNNSAPRKLGFGLMGSGRRAAVPSVFYQEDEEEMPKERMLRPLVPIEYTVEEMQAVAPPRLSAATTPVFSSNLAAAAEFAKSLSNVSVPCSEEGDRVCSRRERERPVDKDRSRRDRDRGRYRERERERHRDKDREKGRDKLADGAKASESKVLDAKQLIDTIPKTREELFAYPVDWKIYDQHGLQERMRPWISKKITEFLGEEESSLVEFIVSHTQKHVTAANMLGLLESILDDEAEMFVLKMWRMLIFEVRRVETGLASRVKA